MSAPGRLRRRTPVAFTAIAAATLVAAAATGTAGAAAHLSKPAKPPITQAVQLLSFNDYHGHIQPDTGTSNDGSVRNEAGTRVPAGGAAYLSTHLSALRAGHANSLTVAAGDLIGGSTFESGVFHDEPSVATLNAMHLDVSSVGNHEFDEGLSELYRMQNGGCHPVDGCYFPGETFPGAAYQYLAANVVDTVTGKTVLPATWIKNVGNTRIGFIGMTLEGTDTLVAPSGIRGLDFQDEIEAGNRAAAQLKKQGVKAIVVLLHEGGFQTGNYNACAGMSGPIVDIAKGLDPQIDAVITGHTHAAYNCTIPDPSGAPRKVVSAMSFGRIITEMNFKINTASGDVMRSTVTAVNHIVTRDVAEDPNVKAIVARWVAKSAEQGNKVVGSTAEPIARAAGAARDKESALSELIADAQLASTAGEGAQIAFMNAGGVRADLDQGPVTYREAFNVQPFNNILQTFTMTGAAIEQVLEQQWLTKDSSGNDVHRVLRLGISDGFTYDWSASAPDGDRINPASIKLNGVALSPTGTYRVTASNFLADGGDAYGAFAQNTGRVGGKVDLDALIDYLGAHPEITAPPVPRSTPLP